MAADFTGEAETDEVYGDDDTAAGFAEAVTQAAA